MQFVSKQYCKKNIGICHCVQGIVFPRVTVGFVQTCLPGKTWSTCEPFRKWPSRAERATWAEWSWPLGTSGGSPVYTRVLREGRGSHIVSILCAIVDLVWWFRWKQEASSKAARSWDWHGYHHDFPAKYLGHAWKNRLCAVIWKPIMKESNLGHFASIFSASRRQSDPHSHAVILDPFFGSLGCKVTKACSPEVWRERWSNERTGAAAKFHGCYCLEDLRMLN